MNAREFVSAERCDVHGKTMRMSVRAKVVCLALSVALLVSVVNIWQSYQTAITDAGHKSEARLSSNMRVAWKTLNPRNETFTAENGELKLGSRTLNGDTSIVDEIADMLGGAATVFMGDTRIATNLRNADGTRATGTKLTSAGATNISLIGGQPFRGEAQILGKTITSPTTPSRTPPARRLASFWSGSTEPPISRASTPCSTRWR